MTGHHEPARRLSDADLQRASAQINAELRRRSSEALHRASLDFQVGDLAEFAHPTRGPVRFTVERINRKTMSGKQFDAALKWRVPIQMCRLVGSSKPEPAAAAVTAPGAGEF